MVQLQSKFKELKEAGIQVVGISYDSTEILLRYSTKNKIEFPLLSDVGSKVIDAYGLRNRDRQDGVPHPGTIILDKEGKVVAKLFYEGYRDRHEADAILQAVQKLPKQVPFRDDRK